MIVKALKRPVTAPAAPVLPAVKASTMPVAAPTGKVAGKADGYNITAVERALDVLDAFRSHGSELTLVEVTRATGLHKPTAFRVLATLKNRGMVIKSEQTGLYRLGYAVVALAESAKSVGGLLVEARPVMRNLRARLRHTVYISVREADARVDIEQMEGLGELRRVITLGTPRPMHVGAPSKVLCAWMQEKDLKALLARTVSTSFDREEFLKELTLVRRNGYARTRSPQNATAIAAPIRNSAGEVIAALTCSVPITVFFELRQQLISGVTEGATAISRALAGSPPEYR